MIFDASWGLIRCLWRVILLRHTSGDLIQEFVLMKAVRSIALLSLLITLPLHAYAQDIGRAKDGRAFRKGADGFKIKDHIAELEVKIDGLQRQVYALEDELRDKDATISRLTGGKGVAKKEVKEADIVPFSGSRQSAGPCDGLQAKVNSLELTLKRVNQLGGTGAVIEEERRRASLCERNLITSKQSHASTKQELLAMRSQVNRLQTALMEGPSEKTLENQQVASRQLEKALAKAQSDLSSSARQEGAQKKTIESLQEQLEKAQKAIVAEQSKAFCARERSGGVETANCVLTDSANWSKDIDPQRYSSSSELGAAPCHQGEARS